MAGNSEFTFQCKIATISLQANDLSYCEENNLKHEHDSDYFKIRENFEFYAQMHIKMMSMK